MTTAFETEVFCSNCCEKFETRIFMSTNSFGPRSTDFYQRAAGEQPLPLRIHTCPHCGYTNFTDDFTATQPMVPSLVKKFVKERLTPLVKQEWSLHASRKYELKAMIEEHIGTPAKFIGYLYHCATTMGWKKRRSGTGG